MPKYDPVLQREVPTDMERFLSGEFEDTRLELRIVRSEIEEMRKDHNAWMMTTNKNLVAIGRAVNGALIFLWIGVFGILVTLISVANQITPSWWHTPWWGL